MTDIRVVTDSKMNRYENFFESIPQALVQQSASWAKAICPLSGDIPYFLIALDGSDNAVGGLPLYLFNASSGKILTSVPHAGPLGGVLCSRDLDPDQKGRLYEKLLGAAIDLARAHRCISLSVISNPFEQDTHYYESIGRPNYILRNYCQMMGQLQGENGSTPLDRINRNVRRNLKKAREVGLKVRHGTLDDFPAWYAIHQTRHIELGATPLPEDLLKGLLVHVAPKRARLLVVELNGRLVGGVIVVWNQKNADIFIMSTLSEALKLGANHLLTEFFTEEFRQNGVEWINWQSCARNSGVYAFKEQWGSIEIPYAYLTWTFEGIERIFKMDLESIGREYPWHYVLPFDAVKKKEFSGVYLKA